MADIDIVTKHAAADKSQQNRTRIAKDLKTISGTQWHNGSFRAKYRVDRVSSQSCPAEKH